MYCILISFGLRVQKFDINLNNEINLNNTFVVSHWCTQENVRILTNYRTHDVLPMQSQPLS